ncbi:MAG TPA: tyrosinase family protein, partial [Longimicrobiaceae bacterium]|nr:tyrosinase family protein [Longimicrobiaceae bacterium]
MSQAAAVHQTRWQRVKYLLRAAAAGSPADYGDRPPWELPLARLLEVEVYGVRMIAPEQAHAAHAAAAPASSCCCGTPRLEPEGAAGQESLPRFPGRGAASGLVRGLRGQAPYDGSVFPRMPWGGKAVAADDVQFISDWIDDGCPAADHETTLPAPVEREGPEEKPWVTPAPDETRVRVSVPSSGGAAMLSEPRQRVNLDCMDEDEIAALRDGFRALYALNKWPLDRRSFNNMALVHQDHCQHGWERFLPWHRVYLYEFEMALQDVAPGVTLPYWDWTMPQYHPDCPETGWIIPRSYQAFLTPEGLRWLQHGADPALPARVAAKVAPLVGKTYASLHRFFRAVMDQGVDAKYTEGLHRNRFIDALLEANSLWYPLRYPAEYTNSKGEPSTLNKTIHYHYPRPEDMREILSLRTFRDFGGGSLYNDSFGFLDQNPHNTMHLWTGGMNPDFPTDRTVGNAAKADARQALSGDVGRSRNRGVRAAGRRFHTREDMYVQQQFGDMFSNLTASFDPVFWPIHVNIDRTWWEWQQMNASAIPADLDSVLTPWSYTIADTLDASRFGYEYVKSSCRIPVGTEQPVGRFVSRPLNISDAVRRSFRTAEVRLHRVPQLDRSCFVRVFLNVPDATADTPLDHPGYAGYLAVFGHGDCIGGPGHCEAPERGRFDLRPRSHNTPRNHRVNVTAA